MGSVATFTLKDSPIENLRPLKVRVIGAGYSGIYLGIRIPQRLRNVDFQIYEKNEGVGGTWYENRYPGRYLLAPYSTPEELGTDEMDQVARATFLHIVTSILSIRIQIGAPSMRLRRRSVGICRGSRISMV